MDLSITGPRVVLPPGSALQTHMGASGFPGLAGQTATAPPLPAPMPPSAPPVFAAPPDQSDAATLHRHALHAYDEAAEALAGAQSLAERVVLLPEKGDLSLEASQMPPYGPSREGRLIRGCGGPVSDGCGSAAQPGDTLVSGP